MAFLLTLFIQLLKGVHRDDQFTALGTHRDAEQNDSRCVSRCTSSRSFLKHCYRLEPGSAKPCCGADDNACDTQRNTSHTRDNSAARHACHTNQAIDDLHTHRAAHDACDINHDIRDPYDNSPLRHTPDTDNNARRSHASTPPCHGHDYFRHRSRALRSASLSQCLSLQRLARGQCRRSGEPY